MGIKFSKAILIYQTGSSFPIYVAISRYSRYFSLRRYVATSRYFSLLSLLLVISRYVATSLRSLCRYFSDGPGAVSVSGSSYIDIGVDPRSAPIHGDIGFGVERSSICDIKRYSAPSYADIAFWNGGK